MNDYWSRVLERLVLEWYDIYERFDRDSQATGV